MCPLKQARLIKVEIIVECMVHRAFLVPHPSYFGIDLPAGTSWKDWAENEVIKQIRIPNDAAIISELVDFGDSKIYEVI